MEEYKGMAAMLFLFFKLVRSETKVSLVSRIKALLVGIFMSMVDVIVSIAIKRYP